MSDKTVRTIGMNTSYDCQQSCVFCSESDANALLRGHFLPLKDAVRILLTKRELGADRLMLGGGGEPTLHPDFVKILQAAKRLGLKTWVVSNGQRFAEPSFAAQTLPLLDELVLSLHGDTAKLHESQTRRRGSFLKIVEAFRHAAELPSVNRTALAVVSRLNWERVEQIVRFGLERCRAQQVCLSNLAPEGRAQQAYKDLAVPLAAWRERLPALKSLARSLGGSLATQFVPLCCSGGALDFDLPPFHCIYMIKIDGKPAVADETVLHDDRKRVKAPLCGDCRKNGACAGVYERYLEIFGASELALMR
ncbi:MAG TPA: hypothetical protein DCZ01_00420 [Elusimicrobia bacterium]|nr:MAG: hypothetical protein A2X37_05305 [Elusimicrobia bacterium GWA2_66_18]HAZ06997.1 hypothetical protein [Elusimicrobiota bacterium]